MELTPELFAYGLGGLFLLVLAVIIIRKFGKMIAAALTIIGGVVVAAVIWAVISLLTGGLDLQTVKAILAVLQ